MAYTPAGTTSRAPVEVEFPLTQEISSLLAMYSFPKLPFISSKDFAQLAFCTQEKREEKLNKDKLFLKDGTQILLESGTMLSDMKVLFSASEDMMCIWCKITKGNLKSVEIENGNGVTVARYFDIILISETSIIQSDGNILTNFVLEKNRN